MIINKENSIMAYKGVYTMDNTDMRIYKDNFGDIRIDIPLSLFETLQYYFNVQVDKQSAQEKSHNSLIPLSNLIFDEYKIAQKSFINEGE